jgi:hypothetical protein
MFVAGLGDLAVFPCSSLKKPMVKAWHKAAKRIEPPEDWIRVGVLTGQPNRFDVLDLELSGLRWLNANPLPETRRHKTPRGWHYLFRCAEGLRGSADNRIADGVHIRSTGNYVIFWPRQGYPVIDAPLADWPMELLARARKKARELAANEVVTPRFSGHAIGGSLVPPNSRESRYARKALSNAFDALANDWPKYLEDGRLVYQQGRNNELNKLAFKMGGLVANGWIDGDRVVKVLMAAAQVVGLVREDGAEQCMATIMSGLRAGMERPYPELGPYAP